MESQVYLKGSLEFSRPLKENEYEILQSLPSNVGPSDHCGWTCTYNYLLWDESDGFQTFLPWLSYLIQMYFDKWNIALNGSIQWTSYEEGDCGVLSVRDSTIYVHYDVDSYN